MLKFESNLKTTTMQTGQNNDNKSQKELEQEQLNKAASEKIANNDAQQNEIFRKGQNEKTQATDADNDADSLINNHEGGQSNDSPTIREKNKRKLESEEDADFGNEQLQ